MKTMVLMAYMATVVAQAAGGSPMSFDWGEVIKAGGIAAICAFVLARLEPRLRGVEAAIDRVTRMIAVMLGELPHVIDAVKNQCRDMEKELDRAAQQRGDQPK
jgi:anaerobic C4-dicarboxylate transporter